MWLLKVVFQQTQQLTIPKEMGVDGMLRQLRQLYVPVDMLLFWWQTKCCVEGIAGETQYENSALFCR
jgi:hypothetical protein